MDKSQCAVLAALSLAAFLVYPCSAAVVIEASITTVSPEETIRVDDDGLCWIGGTAVDCNSHEPTKKAPTAGLLYPGGALGGLAPDALAGASQGFGGQIER